MSSFGSRGPLSMAVAVIVGGILVSFPALARLPRVGEGQRSHSLLRMRSGAEVNLSIGDIVLNGDRSADFAPGPGLLDGDMPAGDHAVTWNGRDDGGRAVASGTYLYRIVAGRDVVTRKMTLAR